MDMEIFAIGLVEIYKYPLCLPRVTNSKMIKIVVESFGLFLVFPKSCLHQLIVFVLSRFFVEYLVLHDEERSSSVVYNWVDTTIASS